jgi:hypothetical protein
MQAPTRLASGRRRSWSDNCDRTCGTSPTWYSLGARRTPVPTANAILAGPLHLPLALGQRRVGAESSALYPNGLIDTRAGHLVTQPLRVVVANRAGVHTVDPAVWHNPQGYAPSLRRTPTAARFSFSGGSRRCPISLSFPGAANLTARTAGNRPARRFPVSFAADRPDRRPRTGAAGPVPQGREPPALRQAVQAGRGDAARRDTQKAQPTQRRVAPCGSSWQWFLPFAAPSATERPWPRRTSPCASKWRFSDAATRARGCAPPTVYPGSGCRAGVAAGVPGLRSSSRRLSSAGTGRGSTSTGA